MTPELELEEFQQRLIAHAKLVVNRAPKVDSEAKTNASLVQPFLTTLGYDVTNPDDVSPEHHADFSDKYQNKVDYAILHNGAPVIALETKRVGALKKGDIGQLRSYFNACQTVKLGIITDGLTYEFYADSDRPNMMDVAAYLRLDLSAVAKNGTIDDNTLSGIALIRRGFFNPEDVGAEAKKKLLFESIIETVKKFKTDPSDDFIRFILERVAKIGKITQKIVDLNRDVVRSAMEAFVTQEALARFGYAPKDVVPAQPEPPTKEEIQHTVEEKLNRCSEHTRELFFALKERIVALDAAIIEEPKAKYISYKLTTNVADVVVLKNSITIILNLRSGKLKYPPRMSGKLKDPSHIFARDLTKPKVGHWGTGDYEVKFWQKAQLDDLMALVRQSYDYNK